jgi:hypothetical protein
MDAVRLLRFVRAFRGRLGHKPAIEFTLKPVVDHGHDLEVSNPFRSIGAGVVILVGILLLTLYFECPQLVQRHLIQGLHCRPLFR